MDKFVGLINGEIIILYILALAHNCWVFIFFCQEKGELCRSSLARFAGSMITNKIVWLEDPLS